MPQITPIQDSFSAGEISPRCYMRSDEEYWQRSVQRLENFFAASRGPAKSRFGFRFLLNESDPQPDGTQAEPVTVKVQISTPQVDVT